jgi:hypothetical protein
MGRNKNKPTKNAAAVSPAALPTGTTEVIAPAPAAMPTAATFVEPAPNPTFTTDDVANPSVDEHVKPEEPKTEEPKTEEPKPEEPKPEEPAKENIINQALAPLPDTGAGGIFGFFRRFYNSLGGAIHR